MKKLQVPEFDSYEAEAEFWDNLDTGPFMEDDGEWFHFETDQPRAIRIAILPQIAEALIQRARAQDISVETLVNVLLLEQVRQTTPVNMPVAE